MNSETLCVAIFTVTVWGSICTSSILYKKAFISLNEISLVFHTYIMQADLSDFSLFHMSNKDNIQQQATQGAYEWSVKQRIPHRLMTNPQRIPHRIMTNQQRIPHRNMTNLWLVHATCREMWCVMFMISTKGVYTWVCIYNEVRSSKQCQAGRKNKQWKIYQMCIGAIHLAIHVDIFIDQFPFMWRWYMYQYLSRLQL